MALDIIDFLIKIDLLSNEISFSLGNLFTKGSIIFIGDNGLEQDNSNLFWDNANNKLGIGTASPGRALSVAGDGSFSGADVNLLLAATPDGDNTGGTLEISHRETTITQDDWLGRILFTGLDSDERTGAIILAQASSGWGTNTNDAPTDIQFFTQDDSNSDTLGSPRMVITEAGLVGIGTTSPSNPLEVVGDVVIRETDDGNDAVKINAGAGGGDIYLYDAGVLKTKLAGNVNGDSYFNTGGNVGIGTTSPSNPLTVASGDLAQLSLDRAGNGAIQSFKRSGTQRGFIATKSTDVHDTFELASVKGLTLTVDSNDQAFVVDTGGNVGIGTTSPSEMLSIHSNTGAGIDLFADVDNDDSNNDARITFGVNGTTGTWALGLDESNSEAFTLANSDGNLNSNRRLVVTTGGNVGIGTTSPGVLFHVSGLNVSGVQFDVNQTQASKSTTGSYFPMRVNGSQFYVLLYE